MFDFIYNTKSMFGNSWSPLSGEIPEYFTCVDLTRQAVQVIKKSRNIWKYCSKDDTSKLKLLQETWKDIQQFSRRPIVSASMANPPIFDISTVPQKCKDIVLLIRKRYASEIDWISDSEIAALYAIDWACRVLKDWKRIKDGGLDMEKNLMFLKNDISVAEAVLAWAEQLQSKNQSDNIDESTLFPTPSGAKWSDLKMTIIGYEKVKIEVKGGKTITTNYKIMCFEDGRTHKPNNAWKLLVEFACKKGILTKFSPNEKRKIEKNIQDIRNTLSKCFKIDGKPIPDYIKKEGYHTAFKIFYRDEPEQKSKELSNFEDNKDDIDS